MRSIWVAVSTCVLALVLVACGGTTLGSEDEGLELLPGAPLPVEEPPPAPVQAEPLPVEELDPSEDPTPTTIPPEDPLEVPEEGEAEAEPVAVNPFIEAVRLLLRGRSARVAVTVTNTLPGSNTEFRVISDGTFGLRNFVGGVDVDASTLIRALGEDGATAAGFVPALMVFDRNTINLN